MKTPNICKTSTGTIIWKERTRLEPIKAAIDEFGRPFILREFITQKVPYCSQCGKIMDGRFLNFCDNCGAEMRGEETGDNNE